MFVLIWATLLFSVKDGSADTGESLQRRTFCQGAYCITLSDRKIRAEAGLCVVISCSFTTSSSFNPQSIDWFKCEPSKPICKESDIIISRGSSEVQSGFRGRVKLLESNIYQRNCSFIINDLKTSDSGSYQLRVNGYNNNWRSERFQYSTKATVSVKGLTQKPTVMVPPLTEGQQTTLSCTAPGLCSGSAPEITWRWRGKRLNESNVTENLETESLSAIATRHSSTLTFTPSAEHHGTNVTCKVSFNDLTSTEETVTLSVSYVKEVKVSVNTPVREGETLNLSCSIESFPPSLLTWTKLSDQNMHNGTDIDLLNDTSIIQENKTEAYLQEGIGEVMFSLINVTSEDSGLYICTAKHLNNTLTKEVKVKVRYLKMPVISGNTSHTKGDTLNLTCSVESFPLSHVTWTFLGSDTELQNDTGSSTLIIRDLTAEDSGRYMCTAQHLNSTVAVYADVSVTWFPSIFKNSGCEIQSQVLTCVCLSEGFPLPTIKWPLLKTHSQYSVVTKVTNHTVNSTITLTVKEHSNTSAECVSSNEKGEVTENLSIKSNTSQKEENKSGGLKNMSWLEVIIAFFLGLLLSAVICFLGKKCKRHRDSGSLDKTLEMVTSQEDPLIDAGQAVEDDYTYDQEVTEGGVAVAEEKSALDLDGGPKDVQYASIDFSALKRRAAKKQEMTGTEYAEIKRDRQEQRGNHDGTKIDLLEDKEEEWTIKEDEETKDGVPQEEEGEDEAIYSSVKEI